MKRRPVNPLCPCRKTGAWRTREAAQNRLDAILASPPTGDRAYTLVAVVRCAHGAWHLTSKAQKLWAAGKPRRRRVR